MRPLGSHWSHHPPREKGALKPCIQIPTCPWASEVARDPCFWASCLSFSRSGALGPGILWLLLFAGSGESLLLGLSVWEALPLPPQIAGLPHVSPLRSQPPLSHKISRALSFCLYVQTKQNETKGKHANKNTARHKNISLLLRISGFEQQGLVHPSCWVGQLCSAPVGP